MKSRIPSQLHALGWNRRVLTLDDFYTACEAEHITVFDVAMHWQGLFLYFEGKPIIALNVRLRGNQRTLVAWHEFGHYCYHYPGSFGRQRKTEREADIIAHVALIPAFLLNLPDGELQEMFGYSSELISARIAIFRQYNL